MCAQNNKIGIIGSGKSSLGKSLTEILKTEGMAFHSLGPSVMLGKIPNQGPLAPNVVTHIPLDRPKLKVDDVIKHIKAERTDMANKMKGRETMKAVKNLQARLMSKEEGPRLFNLMDMTQRGLEFLIDCFDNLEKEKVINQNFLVYDAQKEFLGMQRAFFPKSGFTEAEDSERIEHQKKIDFILSEISRMDKDQLNRIYTLMKKGFNYVNKKK